MRVSLQNAKLLLGEKMNWIFNKNIILSGASSGIGKALATILITKYNCHIMGLARTESKLEAFKQELGDQGNLFDYYPMDVGISENWEKLRDYLIEISFRPDILINNAGTMTPFESFEHINEEQTNRVMRTNFLSVTYAVRDLLPLLQESKTPAIINISSASALGCLPGVSIYSASKSALKSFSEILHAEQRGKVYVATILPGFVKTNLFTNKDNSKDIINQKDKKIIDRFSMRADKMAKKIIRTIKRKRARAVIGADAKFLNICYKLFPQASGKMMGNIMKISKMDTFEDVYKKEK